MSSETEIRLSQGKVRLAIQRLASKYIYHARVLERFVLGTRADVNTMAVSVSGNNVHLWHCPKFVLGLPMDQLVGTLLHEVHHVVLGHLLLDPKKYPDEWALIVATEVTVNEFVKEPLPPGGILLEQFPYLALGESTDRRYRRLASMIDRPPIRSLSEFLRGGGNIGKLSPSTGEAGNGDILLVIDEHGPWGEGETGSNAREVIEAISIDAAIDVGDGRVPRHLRDALKCMGIGTETGQHAEALRVRRGNLPWSGLLRRYIGRAVCKRQDFRYPSRRFPDMIGIVPGRCRLSGRPNILAVIDTSGSISTVLLEQISGELARLARDHDVVVVECDTKIHRTYRFKPLRTVIGRGGTDLRPAMERTFLRKQRADLVIYFTDGFGPAPSVKPPVAVIWCLTPEGTTPAPWGGVIHMNEVRY